VSNPLDPIYEAVAWVLKQIYNGLSPVFGPTSGWTWALSIVLLVALMRLIMVPLFIKQMHTTRAMSALAPQMSALRKKYKNDKQTLNQEMMKLYQQAGVNPLMGCLPVVLQLPMFFALFSVLKAIAEWKPGLPIKYGLTREMVVSAQHAYIFGATIADKVLFTHGLNVPLHAKVVITIFVFISMSTTYMTVRQSMKRGMMPAATPDNPMGQSQRYMAYIMPLFALSGLYWPFGLVLYWVTTNLWTLGQQWLLFKRYPQPKVATADAASGAPAPSGQSGRPRVLPGTSRALSQGSSPAKKDGAAEPGGKPPASGSAPRAGTPGRGAATARGPSAAGGGSGSAGGKQRQNGRKPPPGAAPSAPAPANGQSSAGGGGMLRRLGRSRPEPEPPPPEPEVKLVRQQRQRQSRSKRSGKR
jgi:YidC/Oxa1 family membrane protein insertase